MVGFGCKKKKLILCHVDSGNSWTSRAAFTAPRLSVTHYERYNVDLRQVRNSDVTHVCSGLWAQDLKLCGINNIHSSCILLPFQRGTIKAHKVEHKHQHSSDSTLLSSTMHQGKYLQISPWRADITMVISLSASAHEAAALALEFTLMSHIYITTSTLHLTSTAG